MPPTGAVHRLLAGRYRLVSRIATGGMGEVWRADDDVLARAVAVKLLKAEYADDPEFRARFRLEARHAAGLSHPGIASVYDYGERDGEAWLVMELVDGEPLSAVLRQAGRLPVAQALDIVGQAALALDAAHAAGVVHRDVKPGNLLVRPDGVVKITDFGIARAVDAVPVTRTGTMLGTASYLSPEQAAGRPVSPASDVYSLGVVAYQCLAGRLPFPDPNPVAAATAHLRDEPPALPEDVPVPVRDLVLTALAKDPARRPARAGEFGRRALELRAALTGPADPTLVLPPLRRAGGPRSHRRSVRLAGLAILVLLALLSARAWLGGGQVAVPTVDPGTTVADASALIRGAGLQVRTVREASSSVPAGRVVTTHPSFGTRLPPGQAVTLVVSSGPPPVTVDPAAYLGQPVAQVQAALQRLGLHSAVVPDGTGAPVGTVSALAPTGQLAPGSAVTLHVVPPPPPAPAPVPAPGKRGHGGDHGD